MVIKERNCSNTANRGQQMTAIEVNPDSSDDTGECSSKVGRRIPLSRMEKPECKKCFENVHDRSNV